VCVAAILPHHYYIHIHHEKVQYCLVEPFNVPEYRTSIPITILAENHAMPLYYTASSPIFFGQLTVLTVGVLGPVANACTDDM